MSVLSITFLFLALFCFQKSEAGPSQTEAKKSGDAMIVPTCRKPGRHLRRVGWGKLGAQFDVPTREVEILGGKPDVDYIRYVIKPKTGEGYLEFWFGPYAFNSRPDTELLENSVDAQRRDIINGDGERVGIDNWGKLKTGEIWRHTFLGVQGANGARYKASPENAALFDRIIDSACYVPSP